MRRILPIYLLLLASIIAEAQSIKVAAASSLRGPLEKIVREFENSQAGKIDLVFASSGKLFAQIKQGAPYHLFLSADEHYARKLAEEMSLNAPLILCHGSLALWTSEPFEKDQSFNATMKVGLPNPKFAPYGKLAQSYLLDMGIKPSLQDNFVFGGNVSQVNLYISTAALDAVFTSWSSSFELNNRGHWTKLEEYTLSNFVLCLENTPSEIAQRFMNFLSSESSQKILAEYGYLKAELN